MTVIEIIQDIQKVQTEIEELRAYKTNIWQELFYKRYGAFTSKKSLAWTGLYQVTQGIVK